jgi:hypothetical protein
MEFKRNQIVIEGIIKKGIERGIRKILPLAAVLKEYLINSVNIINEPPKVELLGLPSNGMKQIEQSRFSLMPNTYDINMPKPLTNNEVLKIQELASEKYDPKLEQDVRKILQSDSKTDKESVRQIMRIEQLIESMTSPSMNNKVKNDHSHQGILQGAASNRDKKNSQNKTQSEYRQKNTHHSHSTHYRQTDNTHAVGKSSLGDNHHRMGREASHCVDDPVSPSVSIILQSLNMPSSRKRMDVSESVAENNDVSEFIEQYGE